MDEVFASLGEKQESSPEATAVYQRKVVAEIRTRSDREETLPQLSEGYRRQGSYDGVLTQNVDDYEVLMKAKWGSASGRRGQGSNSGWSLVDMPS